MKGKVINALLIKEFYQIIRDPSSLLIALFFPVLLLFIYGVGLSLDMNDVKIGLVMQDTSPDAQTFALSLKNSKYFTVEEDQVQKNFEQKIISGKLRGIVVVPFYFSRFERCHQEQAPIYVIADGSEPNSATFVQNYVQGAYFKFLTQQFINKDGNPPPLVTAQPRFWYNEELNSRFFLVPGSIAIIMTLVGTLLTALVIAREWERGTMEALIATPITMREMYFAKFLAYFCLGILAMSLCTAMAIFIYGVPYRGSFFLLLFVSSVFLFTSLGTGLFISTLARNQFVASQVSIITAFLPAFMLSGFVFEISSMPLPIQIISYLLPARYMVSCLQTLFLVGNVRSLLLINTAYMFLVGVILFGIIFSKTKKRLDA